MDLQDKDLVEYTRYDLPELSFFTPLSPDRVAAHATFFAEDIDSEFILLVGDTAPLFAVALLYKIASKATEIVYQKDEASYGYVIFSLLDTDRYLRPVGIEAPGPWNDEQLQTFETQQSTDTRSELTLDIGALWSDAQKDTNKEYTKQLVTFLSQVYIHSPAKENVELRNATTEIVPLLLASAWFRREAKRVLIDGTIISSAV